MHDTLASPRESRRRRPGGPRRWTAADKAAYLAAFATSHQTIEAFCRETGVPRATFNLWQREAREARAAHRTRRARSQADGPTFARVELPTTVAARGMTLLIRSVGLEAELTGLDPAAVVVVVAGLLRARSA